MKHTVTPHHVHYNAETLLVGFTIEFRVFGITLDMYYFISKEEYYYKHLKLEHAFIETKREGVSSEYRHYESVTERLSDRFCKHASEIISCNYSF